MSDLTEKLRQILSKEATAAADSEMINSAEKDPKPTASVANPADAQTGAAADVIATSNGVEGRIQPGTESTATEVDSANAPAGGIDAALVEPNKEGEAEKVLGVKKDEVTKEEGIDVINKAANAIREIGARLANLPDAELAACFEKKASAQDTPQELLIKAASAGDSSAQFLVDMLASYELGLAKKANDLKEISEAGATPEQVAAAETALNEAAMENPDLLLEEEAAADIDPEAADVLQQVGAEIESAAQEATADVAEAILEQDPSIPQEEAYAAAQEAVVDALMTIDAQQAIGAADEEGNYAVDDAAAAAAVDELAKSASAHPMRDAICGELNKRFGLSPKAFATRLGY